MNCPNCNAPFRETARFCPNCGTSVSGLDAAESLQNVDKFKREGLSQDLGQQEIKSFQGTDAPATPNVEATSRDSAQQNQHSKHSAQRSCAQQSAYESLSNTSQAIVNSLNTALPPLKSKFKQYFTNFKPVIKRWWKIGVICIVFILLLKWGCGSDESSNKGKDYSNQGYSSELQDEANMKSKVAQYAGTYEIYVDNRFLENAAGFGFTTLYYVTINKDGSCDINILDEGSYHYDDCYIDGNHLIFGGGEFVFQTSRVGHSLDFTDEFKRNDRQEHGGINSITMSEK